MDGVGIRKFKVFPYGGCYKFRGRTHARMRLRSFGAMRCVVQVLIPDTTPRLDLFRACPSGNLILSGGGCGQTGMLCVKLGEWLVVVVRRRMCVGLSRCICHPCACSPDCYTHKRRSPATRTQEKRNAAVMACHLTDDGRLQYGAGPEGVRTLSAWWLRTRPAIPPYLISF